MAAFIRRAIARLGRLRQDRLLRRAALLSGGVVLGQALYTAILPLVTRLYSPDDFGLFAVFSTFSGILGVAVTLRYELAIPISEDDRAAADTVALTMLVTVAMAAILALAIWLLGPKLAAWIGMPRFAPLLWALPPLLLAWGGMQALAYWSIRQGRFRVNAVNKALHFVAQGLGQLALGVVLGGPAGLCLGYASGYAVRVAHFLGMLSRPDRLLLRRARLGRMWRLAREHWRYAALSTPSALMQSSVQFLPAILVALLYGPAMAGLFALAQRLLDVPVRLLSGATGEAFLGEIARLDPPAIYRLFVKTGLRFLVIGLIGTVPLLFAGPALFAFVFGEPWRLSGAMMQCLLPAALARFTVVPIIQTLYVLRRQDIHLLAAGLNLLAMAAGFLIGWQLGLSPLRTLLLYGVGSAAGWLAYAALTWRIARDRAFATEPSLSPRLPASTD
jgi:O-antigen/teichoic acid export membrane protein